MGEEEVDVIEMDDDEDDDDNIDVEAKARRVKSTAVNANRKQVRSRHTKPSQGALSQVDTSKSWGETRQVKAKYIGNNYSFLSSSSSSASSQACRLFYETRIQW